AQHGAGDRDSLALTTGELHAMLPNQCVVTLWQLFNKSVGKSSRSGGFDFLIRGAFFAVADIVAHGVVKQSRFLTHKSYLATQARHGDVAKIAAANRNLAGLHIVETRNEVDDG